YDGVAENAFKAPVVQLPSGTVLCQAARSSSSSDLLYGKASGTSITYETPHMTATSFSVGYNAAAFADITAYLQPTNKSISAWLGTNVFRAKAAGNQTILLTYPQSSDTNLVSPIHYDAVPVLPLSTGLARYSIYYDIARP